jgi:tRNA-2-methylthio-N6-dimethylallyladenosine synthase
VVPYARGREVSRPADEILVEVRSLVRTGYKMITLLGQNVNSYHGAWGMKHETKNAHADFAELLKKINAIPGKFWITFVSSHPKDMDDKLIETIARCKKVCEWIHLPIQAGDDEILKKMNRKYTQKHYLERIKKIKSAFKKHKPAVPFSISTDIIVGFPGEIKKQFLQSAAVMEKAKFDMAFFGQFSPRPGTVAWKMKDNVSKEEKARRENMLNDILKKTALANNKKYIGKTLEILIEKEKNGNYFGKTRTQKNVKITSSKIITLKNFVKVKVTKANIWNLEGTVVK